MVETLAPLKYGRVLGRYGATGADSAEDPDALPDTILMTGTCTFTPLVDFLLVPTASPKPTTIVPVPITVELTNGEIWHNGLEGVWLNATDDPATNPTNWFWRVSFALEYNMVPITLAGFKFSVPANVDTHLTTATPIIVTQALLTIAGPIGPAGPAGDTNLALAFALAL